MEETTPLSTRAAVFLAKRGLYTVRGILLSIIFITDCKCYFRPVEHIVCGIKINFIRLAVFAQKSALY